MFYAIVLAAAPLLQAAVPGDLLSSSVTVLAPPSSYGSGVIFKSRKSRAAFVWTAAHVVKAAQRVDSGLDPLTLRPVSAVRYRDVLVMTPRFMGGRKVGEDMRYASVVRYSDAERGHDLALLRLYDHTFGGPGVTFSEAGFVPRAGQAVWHVGSPHGRLGMSSVSDGVFSTAGRLLSETERPLVYDQVTLASLPGSSGGGFFLKSDSRCIGILTGGLTADTECLNTIVPARRLREFARKSRCLWAVDHSLSVPESDDAPVTCLPIPLPPPPPMPRASD